MKVFKNLLKILFYFIIFFSILFIIHFVKIADPFSDLQKISMARIKLFISNNVFVIVLISSAISILLLGSLNKLVGTKSIIIALFFFTAIICLYPAAIIYSDGRVKKILTSTMTIYETLPYVELREKTFNSKDDYLIQANLKVSNDYYKNVILIDNGMNGNLYFSDYAIFNKDNISLENVKEMINDSPKFAKKNSVSLPPLSKQVFDSALEYASGIGLYPVINAIVKVFTAKTAPTYSIAVIFALLFFFLLSLYMLSASLSSTVHMYHNMLTVLVIYFGMQTLFNVIIKTFNINYALISKVNFVYISASILGFSILIFLISLMFRKIFNFHSYYSDKQ